MKCCFFGDSQKFLSLGVEGGWERVTVFGEFEEKKVQQRGGTTEEAIGIGFFPTPE